MLLGIDTGGTFTDFVFFDGNEIVTHKVLSTPADPERSILQGIMEMGIPLDKLRLIHGSTVATNAVLEGKGARVVYITNRGMMDTLTIGRQARTELYNLNPEPVAPPVADDCLLETGGRLSAAGKVIEDLTAADLANLSNRIKSIAPESVAINLLFSFLDNRFEKRIESALPEELFISCSSDVLREYREYERGITTWLNAYVGPLVKGYLGKLKRSLSTSKISVMRSSGDTCSSEIAGQEAVHLILSGPAGGLAGAKYIAASAGIERIMTFDMGGTSTDVALIDGEIELTNRGRISHYPVAVPMVDMHTIGAGGGSIAYLDEGGGLQVGPESAGADPGPVCYGRGGTRITVTDANLVLGRLPKAARLGGTLAPDFHSAYAGLTALADDLELDTPEEAALGIIRIANEHMAQALRVISVQRGIDPRQFTLVAFGGAGGLHVCNLADDLEIKQVLAPVQAGVLSALGMLVAPAGRQLTCTLARKLNECSDEEINAELQQLAETGQNSLEQEGLDRDSIISSPAVDLCYTGQGSSLTIPWSDRKSVEQQFHDMHKTRYGHTLDSPVELVNLRMSIRSPGLRIDMPEIDMSVNDSDQYSTVYGCEAPVPVTQRSEISIEQEYHGPLIICDPDATIYVAPGWQCRKDKYGNLDIKSMA